jgi:hypothetical protein
LCHDTIESWRAAEQYEKYRVRLRYEPLDEDKLARLEQDYNELLGKYGPSYGTPYGWAAAALSNPRPNFADIEKAISMDHHRVR